MWLRSAHRLQNTRTDRPTIIVTGSALGRSVSLVSAVARSARPLPGGSNTMSEDSVVSIACVVAFAASTSPLPSTSVRWYFSENQLGTRWCSRPSTEYTAMTRPKGERPR